MTSSMIKVIALAAMIMDHIGAIYFPQYAVFRIIGRIALPLFAWQLTISLDKTHDAKKLLTRVFIFALLSQIPYSMIFGSRLNIFFSFTLSIATLMLYRKKKAAGYAALFLSIVLSQGLNIEYGWYAVLMVFLFYLYKENIYRMIISQALLNLAYLPPSNEIQVFSLLSLLLIYLYNNERGGIYKYKLALYCIYPVHLLVLVGLHRLIG